MYDMALIVGLLVAAMLAIMTVDPATLDAIVATGQDWLTMSGRVLAEGLPP